jgi:hypothetical protein
LYKKGARKMLVKLEPTFYELLFRL